MFLIWPHSDGRVPLRALSARPRRVTFHAAQAGGSVPVRCCLLSDRSSNDSSALQADGKVPGKVTTYLVASQSYGYAIACLVVELACF